ncbi:MAG: aldo/keto reductase [Bacteroidales bacterium]|nr:aldo/keto reductase [Bacteroidales bacterium]MCF8405495.1 aldo/keto reductase [Bacteroidales bacterium]
MEFRKIGNTELELSVVTFGAWAAGGWMWGGTETNESVKAIQAAYDHGITSIDTAPVYGMGRSEMIVGQAIKDIPRDKVQILTKYGLRWDTKKGDYFFSSFDNDGNAVDIHKYASKESIIEECESSLRYLGTDYIDLYQIHWPNLSTPIQETMEAVEKLIQSGKVRYAGVSNFSLAQFEEADTYLNIVSNQVAYSMLRREIESELLPHHIKEQKSILAYSPMERGLLTGKMTAGQAFPKGDHRAGLAFYQSENIKRTNEFLDKIKPIAEEKNVSIGQLVVRWTIDQPGITIALVGARNAAQSVQNAGAADIELSEKELSFIKDELKLLKLNV